MSLDFSKPYAEIHGLRGAVYEQNGLYYKSDGAPATGVASFVDEIIVQDDSVPPPIACYEQETLPASNHHDERNLEDMHWRHLKPLVEIYGGEWTNKQDAIKFIKGKQ